MDRLRAMAWNGLAGDVRATRRRLGRVCDGFYQAHPFLALGGAAIVGAAVASQSLPTLKLRGLLGLATFWIGRAVRVVEVARRLRNWPKARTGLSERTPPERANQEPN